MIHLKIRIQGIVQGVGFRPFLHRLAKAHHISGTAYNDSKGVILHIQGHKEDVQDFLKELPQKAPCHSKIESIDTTKQPLENWNSFTIQESKSGIHQTLISPDMAPCQDCVNEMLDPKNRRFGYPFINCTNCGPRYTIVKDIPYDRKNTTMKEFTMCSLCQQEYEDLQDRRYHAQPNACANCGPTLFYQGEQKKGDPLENAIQDLKEGKIVAIKGIGGIHLACDARDPKAILRLRKRKHRETKPLAVMVKDIDTAKEFVQLSVDEEKLLISTQRPIVLCAKKNKEAYKELSENKNLGILLPYSPLHILLMEKMDALVMTSANLSDAPVLIDNNEALEDLKHIADSFLLHNRTIENRCDDSLLRNFQGKPYFIRRSRGYVPIPLSSKTDITGILALGAHQKGSFAWGKDHYVFLSPYIGDLETIETFNHYKKALHTYQRLFDLEARQIVCDLHPDYTTTRFAKSLSLPLIQVQHHHAHMASCMMENNLDELCFGILFDGTGFGSDHTIWGSEFLIGDYTNFKRVGSIKQIPLLGGDKAIHEIGRIALALSIESNCEIPIFETGKQKILKQMLSKSIQTSGMGRLFDGFYALITHTKAQDYDGQAPVLLESMAATTTESYPLCFYEENNIRFFDWSEMIHYAVTETKAPEIQAAKMMNTIIEMTIDQTLHLNPKHLPIVLSGGCFQNQYLLKEIVHRLQELQYRVYWHTQVSCNDEGIALGQLAIAQKRM